MNNKKDNIEIDNFLSPKGLVLIGGDNPSMCFNDNRKFHSMKQTDGKLEVVFTQSEKTLLRNPSITRETAIKFIFSSKNGKVVLEKTVYGEVVPEKVIPKKIEWEPTDWTPSPEDS